MAGLTWPRPRRHRGGRRARRQHRGLAAGPGRAAAARCSTRPSFPRASLRGLGDSRGAGRRGGRPEKYPHTIQAFTACRLAFEGARHETRWREAGQLRHRQPGIRPLPARSRARRRRRRARGRARDRGDARGAEGSGWERRGVSSRPPSSIGAGGHRCPVAKAFGEVSEREEVVVAQESETRLPPDRLEALGASWPRPSCSWSGISRAMAGTSPRATSSTSASAAWPGRAWICHGGGMRWSRHCARSGRLPRDLPIEPFRGHAYVVRRRAPRRLAGDALLSRRRRGGTGPRPERGGHRAGHPQRPSGRRGRGGASAPGAPLDVVRARRSCAATDRASPAGWAGSSRRLPRPGAGAWCAPCWGWASRGGASSSAPLRDAGGAVVSARRRQADAQAIAHHYDVSNEFYELFLDPLMVYTCAYYRDPDGKLEQAQQDKLDLVCRKLELRPGETLLDIGCGWGSLAIWAAQHYGVRAHGVTLSRAQADYAAERIAARGHRGPLPGRVPRLPRSALRTRRYDKIAAVGVIEHVGHPELSGLLRRRARPAEGRRALPQPRDRPRVPLEAHQPDRVPYRHVFPNGDLAGLSETLTEMERAGLEILDVEGLRLHYARTCRQWVERLRARADEARALAGERTYRTWLLYLACSAVAFEDGLDRSLPGPHAQAPRSRGGSAPRTREHLYDRTPGERGGSKGHDVTRQILIISIAVVHPGPDGHLRHVDLPASRPRPSIAGPAPLADLLFRRCCGSRRARAGSSGWPCTASTTPSPTARAIPTARCSWASGGCSCGTSTTTSGRRATRRPCSGLPPTSPPDWWERHVFSWGWTGLGLGTALLGVTIGWWQGVLAMFGHGILYMFVLAPHQRPGALVGRPELREHRLQLAGARLAHGGREPAQQPPRLPALAEVQPAAVGARPLVGRHPGAGRPEAGRGRGGPPRRCAGRGRAQSRAGGARTRCPPACWI